MECQFRCKQPYCMVKSKNKTCLSFIAWQREIEQVNRHCEETIHDSLYATELNRKGKEISKTPWILIDSWRSKESISLTQSEEWILRCRNHLPDATIMSNSMYKNSELKLQRQLMQRIKSPLILYSNKKRASHLIVHEWRTSILFMWNGSQQVITEWISSQKVFLSNLYATWKHSFWWDFGRQEHSDVESIKACHHWLPLAWEGR